MCMWRLKAIDADRKPIHMQIYRAVSSDHESELLNTYRKKTEARTRQTKKTISPIETILMIRSIPSETVSSNRCLVFIVPDPDQLIGGSWSMPLDFANECTSRYISSTVFWGMGLSYPSPSRVATSCAALSKAVDVFIPGVAAFLLMTGLGKNNSSLKC